MTEVALAPSLRLTILRRLSSLPDQTLQVLRAGSLLGSSFSSPSWRRSWLGRSPSSSRRSRQSIAAGVLDEHGVRLRFRHDLLREAIYADMPPSLRLGLHREAATRLADIGAPATRVADQFARGAAAATPRPSTG